jgi:hypothetical protein
VRQLLEAVGLDDGEDPRAGVEVGGEGRQVGVGADAAAAAAATPTAAATTTTAAAAGCGRGRGRAAQAQLDEFDEFGREDGELDQQRLVTLQVVEVLLADVQNVQEVRVVLVGHLDVDQLLALAIVGRRAAPRDDAEAQGHLTHRRVLQRAVLQFHRQHLVEQGRFTVQFSHRCCPGNDGRKA